MFPAKFARLFLILRVGIKAARNVLQVEKKVNFEPCKYILNVYLWIMMNNLMINIKSAYEMLGTN